MYLSLDDLWNKTLELLKNEMSTIGYSTWIAQLKPIMKEENVMVFEVDVEFTKNIINTRYKKLIEMSLFQVTNNNYTISIVLPKEQENQGTNYGVLNKSNSLYSNLNPEYTFDKFVIGENNRFAHAASVAVAEAPSSSYNPLFLYGESGLGKTHLMHAIGHHILSENPDAKVVYIQCEKFVNEFIESISSRNNLDFRNKYRNVDVLMIDDIHFLAKKIQTQEGFFHTFNALYENNKQIILTSDKPPSKIETLQNRLITRFEQGLLADVGKPDYETRVAILRKRAKEEDVIVSDEVTDFIANYFESDIRKLIGALTRIIAYSSLTESEITLELTETVFKDIINKQNDIEITIPVIIDIVAKKHGITSKELISKNRTKDIVYPRQIAIYLCRKHTNSSLPKIGKNFGGRDHTTILHSYEKINRLIKDDVSLVKEIEEIERSFT